jgi:hypothetical protein
MSFGGPGSGVLRYSRIAGVTAAVVMVAAGSLASLAGSPQATATGKPEQPPTETITVTPGQVLPPAPPGVAQLIILPPQPAPQAPYMLLPPPAGAGG